MRVLIVEDNVSLADELTADLKRSGYAVDWLADGRDALVQAAVESYDVILLDLGLPGKSGLEILREWRATQMMSPVIVLTARDHWSDRIEGLKAGADDYLTKPFYTEELRLRMQAVLRRTHGTVNQPYLDAGNLQLDESRQSVIQDGNSVELTAGEFRLLRYFMLHQGKIISIGQLQDHLYDGETERDSNVIQVHINHLRSKLGKDLIETKRGQGYRLQVNETAKGV
jgi:two-component system, OmpR family, response regulator